MWRALDIRYDQCVGNCECLPGRDLRDDYITVHFRCVDVGALRRGPTRWETEQSALTHAAPTVDLLLLSRHRPPHLTASCSRSCIQNGLRKPGFYESERDFMSEVYHRGVSCTRWYFVGKFYATLVRAGARLDPPYWEGPPVPLWNETHDNTVVRAHRKALKAKGEGVRVW